MKLSGSCGSFAGWDEAMSASNWREKKLQHGCCSKQDLSSVKNLFKRHIYACNHELLSVSHHKFKENFFSFWKCEILEKKVSFCFVRKFQNIFEKTGELNPKLSAYFGRKWTPFVYTVLINGSFQPPEPHKHFHHFFPDPGGSAATRLDSCRSGLTGPLLPGVSADRLGRTKSGGAS